MGFRSGLGLELGLGFGLGLPPNPNPDPDPKLPSDQLFILAVAERPGGG